MNNKNIEYKNAQNKGRNKKMGLNNRKCENPKYWCKIHRVWLSEEDAKEKHCFEKPTFDMMGYQKCKSLANAEDIPMYHEIYNK